ncbi:MAG: hypothetical protein ABSC07_12880 [Terriglobales bacterium]
MDIHPPHGPVNSFKDFLLHLLTVILGILIALSLEGLIEWHHHRSLAEEARSNLTAEIRENRQLLAGGLPAAPAAEQRLKATIETIEAYRKDRRDDRTSKLDWSFGLFPLSATGWSTASSTGALSYMDYSEVQGYTRAYVLQDEFLTMQQNALGKWLDLQKWLARRDSKGSLSNLNDEELSEVEAAASAALLHTETEETFAKDLMQQYAKALREK